MHIAIAILSPALSLGSLVTGEAHASYRPVVQDSTAQKGQRSDQELRRVVDAWLTGQSQVPGEAALVQISKRSRDVWEPLLEGWLASVRDDGEVPEVVKYARQEQEILLLTALRRIQGREDPLTVEAALLGEGPFFFPELPVVGVRLLHTEGEPEAFAMQIGGNYRSGRLGRWDIELTDEKGKPHRGVDDWAAMMGGGVSTTTRAEPGFIWGIDPEGPLHVAKPGEKPKPPLPVPLPLSSYRKPSAFGKFTLKAAYHNSETIADRDDISDLLVFRSKPLGFEWKPREISMSREDERRILRTLETLYAREKACITAIHLPRHAGSKAKDAHPLDHLFAEGWKALPVLIDVLQTERAPLKRAHLFAALHSLSGLENPSGHSGRGTVAEFERYGGYVPQGSGVGSTPMYGSGKGKIRAAAQDRAVERWLGHRLQFKVTWED